MRGREIIYSGNSVRRKEGDKLSWSEAYCIKGIQKLVSGINWLRNDEGGRWTFRLWTSDRELSLRRSWTDAKTKGTSKLNTIAIMLGKKQSSLKQLEYVQVSRGYSIGVIEEDRTNLGENVIDPNVPGVL